MRRLGLRACDQERDGASAESVAERGQELVGTA
jgi:hypothetical protein